MKGNVVDLAVGVIIGAAFGKIVDSIVKDLIMPVVGKIFGGLDFSNYFVQLGNLPADYKGAMTYEALTKAGVPLFAYGNFITVAINFIILAFIIFMMVKQINRLKKRSPAGTAAGAAGRRGAAARNPRLAEEVAGRHGPRVWPHTLGRVRCRAWVPGPTALATSTRHLPMNPPLPRLPAALTAAAQRIKVTARDAAQRCVDALGVAALASTSNSEREDLLAAQFELNRKLSAFSLTFNERLDDSMAADMRRREGASGPAPSAPRGSH